MGINNTAMTAAADTLQTLLLYAQLHSGLAGTDGTDNVTTAARQPIDWTSPSGLGDFALTFAIDFTGGAPGGPVYSVTLWDDDTAGVFYGELALDGDTVFSSAGEYTITALDFTGILEGT